MRLWLSGCGRCESLGLMEPRGGRLVLDRRLSRRELCRFPAQIERAELAEQRPSGAPRGSLSRRRPMMHPMLYGAVTPERSLSQR